MEKKPGVLRLLPLLISLGLAACGGSGGSSSSTNSSGDPVNTGDSNTPRLTDTIAPGIVSSSPEDKGDGNLSTDGLQVVFTEPMKAADPASMATDTDPTRINASTVTVTDKDGVAVKGQLHYAGNTVIFVPDASLTSASASYKITIKGSVQDLAGNAMNQDRSILFTTPESVGRSVVRDGKGNLYFVGSVMGSLGSVTGSGAKDVFVTKVPADGSLPWTKLIGSNLDEDATGIALDVAGDVYVAGTTAGVLPNLSTGATQEGGTDAFAVKLDAMTGTVLWTQQMGTAEDQAAGGIAVGSDGVYLTGYTHGGPGFAGGTDAFLVKINLSDGQRQWVHLLGTTGNERGQAVAVDASGVYMVGYAESTVPNLPAGEGYQGAGDIFLAKYSIGGALQWTHQRGTPANDVATGITLDSTGNVYLAGQTNGQLDGNTNASGISGGTHDVFLMKYEANGAFQWAKQTGSTATERVSGIAANSTGIYVSGCTYGALPGMTANAGRSDLFLIKFSANPVGSDGKIALWYQQQGTSMDDLTGGLALDDSGSSHVIGSTKGVLSGSGLTALLGNLNNQLFYTRFTPDGSKL